MLSPARPQSSGEHSSSESPRILESRSAYRSCHIRVPDQDQRLAAVFVDKKYYSFFKVAKNEQHALEVCSRLARRGDTAVITKTAKGYAIWVLEPEALLDNPSKTTHPSPSSQPVQPVLSQILEFRNQYQPCHIRVPDLDKRLAAVQVNDKYYSLLKVAKDRQHALEVAARLINRGSETIVIKNAKDYTIWVLEPEAVLDVRLN
jgi:hypothetical protein